MKKGYTLVACALAVVLAGGCSDSATGPTVPGGSQGVSFNPSTSSPPPPANSLTLRQSSSSANSVTIDVVATQVNDFYGAGFDVVWDPSILTWTSASEGSFLNMDGTSTTFAAMLADVLPGPGEDFQQGRLNVGLSRVGLVPGNTGSGTVAVLTFQSVASGSTSVGFEAFFNSTSSGGDVSGLQWIGGTASVR